ncbi:MAG: redox-sensing transcriptional repressor Rex, partial [Synergistaceae bacterium]|nr:redox-sensing transcriptional repressor Rex [Synergistaceae bacterium]
MKVAEPTIERLVQYHRLLETLRDEGRHVVSSQQIGELLGFKASQVRKDLSYFGEIGKRGVGYQAGRLCDHIGEILASPKIWRIAMAGVGNMGTALLSNPAFRSPKIRFEALFDIDPAKT